MESRSSDVFGRERGQLKVFIGFAPGVGKTYTMLREAIALKERGVDIVVGFVDAHNRPDTLAQMQDLESIIRKSIHYHNRVFYEVNLEVILERNPDVVIIDELAHSNVPGSMFPKRYMDVEYLLDQGISVMTAVNVQHLEGIHKEAEDITGIRVREVIPASFIKRAVEVSVIDVTPETLRQRLRDGSIYPSDKVDHALQNFFRKSNLSGLRELALRVVAEDVDERLERSYSRRKIPGPIGAKEVIMVCVSHFDRAVKLISRGHRMAVRMKSEIYVLTIARTREESMSEKEKAKVERLRELAKEHDAGFILEPRNDRQIGTIIVETAARLNVTQIVIGQTRRGISWNRQPWTHNPLRYLLRHLHYTDLRIVGWRESPRLVSASSAQEPQPQGNVDITNPLRGRLTIYVGAAPGVGKTYKMLQDAHDLKKRGWDVVIGLIETHGRSETAEQIQDLEMIPRRRVNLGGRDHEELDVAAVVQRKPLVVLIDELAHSNVPGSDREKRYQDIEYILNQGINVITAVNVQHLESLHDKVQHITGVKVRERIPDWFMKLATEVKLIDVTPETLQQRLMEGRIYARDKVERALDNFFQTANLAALREVALLEVAHDVEQRMERDQDPLLEVDSANTERILVCVNHRPHSEKLIRRGWRLADRLKAQLWVLVVLSDHRLTEQEEQDLLRIRRLSEQFEARFVVRYALKDNVGKAIVQAAEELNVSQLVAGQPFPPRRLIGRLKSNPIDFVLENAEFVDLHIVSYARDSVGARV